MANYTFSIQVDAALSSASIGNIQSQLNNIGKRSKINIDPSSIKKTSSALNDATKQSNMFGQSIGDAVKKMALWSIAGTA
jgi:hypothetical protein